MLHFTARTDDSHAVPSILYIIKLFSQIKVNKNTYIGKVSRGLSN